MLFDTIFGDGHTKTVTINDKVYNINHSLTSDNGKIYIDGVHINDAISIDDKVINVTVNGDINTLTISKANHVDVTGDIEKLDLSNGCASVTGDVGNVDITNGNCNCYGDVLGDINLTNGIVRR